MNGPLRAFFGAAVLREWGVGHGYGPGSAITAPAKESG